MSDFFYSNYQVKKDVQYFLYIGELKNYWLNSFLAESLTRIQGREFDFIAIVPDALEHYDCPNLIVVNPEAERYCREHGCGFSCRLPGCDFMATVSSDPRVRKLVRSLAETQDDVYIYMYESIPEMTLDSIPGVSVLGPASGVAYKANNKITQYTQLSKILPMPEFRVCDGLETLVRTVDGLWDQWSDGIFVTEEYSAAGAKSVVALGNDDIAEKFRVKNRRYLASRFIPHEHDPTVLAAVANENDVYVAGVADQRIEHGNRFTGSTFPSVLPPEIIRRLTDLTRVAGRWLGARGYRGIFGCDYIVDKNGDIRFLEINARKQGTTMEFCCTLEQSLPAGAPILPELEYWATTAGKFPENTAELSTNPRNIHWGTYNYKMGKRVRTSKHIPRKLKEREAFQMVADGSLSSDHIVLEHAGNDFVVAEGAFIGRVVAIGHDHGAVDEGLARGREKLESSFYDMQNSENENE